MPTIRGIVIALAVVVLSLILRFVLLPMLGTAVPYLQFFPAIMIASRYGGRTSGIVATLASTAAAMFFLLGPTRSFRVIALSDLVSLPVFVVVGLAIAQMYESLRRAVVDSQASARRASDAAMQASIAERRLSELVADVPGLVWEAWGVPDDGAPTSSAITWSRCSDTRSASGSKCRTSG